MGEHPQTRLGWERGPPPPQPPSVRGPRAGHEDATIERDDGSTAPAVRSAAPLLQALLVTFLWSTSWVLIKIGLDDELQPLTFAGLRYSLAAVLLLALLVRSPERRRELASTSTRTRVQLVVLGLVLYALTQGAQFVGLALLPAATLSLLLSFTPALVTLSALRTPAERADARQWGGMVLAVLGAALYLGPELGVTSAVGLAVGIVGLVANAAASRLGREVNRTGRLGALTVTAPSMALGGVVTLVVGVAVEGLPRLPLSAWAIVVWLAVVNTAFAFTLWNHTLRSLTATESSAINNTMLVQIAVLAWLVLGEALTLAQWGALALVSVGIWSVRRRP
jgi:drug/metabolite transporter (DMT)-like permease